MKPSPFLKWAGGKSQLLQQFVQFIPSNFNQYIEPFLGGGAVFFYLFSKNNIKEAVLLDSNKELIDCYIAIKRNIKGLIRLLERYKKQHYRLQEEYYYHIRNQIRNNKNRWVKLSVTQRATVTIYLNKTCYNGLYRVNRDNQFNVPVGRYHNPEIYDVNNLIEVSKALKTVRIIKSCDFSECLKYAKQEDFVYLDPPYNPLNKTSSFTGYTKDGFGEQEQIRLAKVYNNLNKIGCKVMLSNSNTAFIKKLYNRYRIEIVKATRAINCKAAGRGKIKELVVLNY